MWFNIAVALGDESAQKDRDANAGLMTRDQIFEAQRKAREWTPPAGAKEVYQSPGHKEDWFHGIRTGQKTIMNIDAAVGVANLCILGNLSFILHRPLEWDQARQEIVGDEQARRMMSRPQRHPYHL